MWWSDWKTAPGQVGRASGGLGTSCSASWSPPSSLPYSVLISHAGEPRAFCMLNTCSYTERSSWLLLFFLCIWDAYTGNMCFLRSSSLRVLGFRKLTTTYFWPLDSWPSQLIENSDPETKMGPGFDFGKSRGSYSTFCLEFLWQDCMDDAWPLLPSS